MVKSLHVKSCILSRVSIDFMGLFVCFSVFVVPIMCYKYSCNARFSRNIEHMVKGFF